MVCHANGAGDILNIRNIEQGLENLKRVPSADANMELVANGCSR